jgi:clan AA aspartic protease
MISGRVSVNLEAVISVRVANLAAPYVEIDAIVDTGYNGWLSLPPVTVSALSLPSLAPIVVTLADGSQRVVRRHLARIEWDGQEQTIRVVCLDGDPLIGTGLLQDYKLEAEFTVGGQVQLWRLP